MYFCLKCGRTHERTNEEILFETGFYHHEGNQISVGICLNRGSSKLNKMDAISFNWRRANFNDTMLEHNETMI
jgi:hypothetical protein